MSDETKNQGEGNKEAAERYNKSQEEFVQSQEGKKQIDNAGDLEINEEVKEAEEEGKSKARK